MPFVNKITVHTEGDADSAIVLVRLAGGARGFRIYTFRMKSGGDHKEKGVIAKLAGRAQVTLPDGLRRGSGWIEFQTFLGKKRFPLPVSTLRETMTL